MFSFTRSRSRLQIKNSRSRSRPKTGRLQNPEGGVSSYIVVYRDEILLNGKVLISLKFKMHIHDILNLQHLIFSKSL